MAAGEIHLNDVGTVIALTMLEGTAPVDVSAATVTRVVLRKPSGERLACTGSFATDGADGVIQYATVAGDLDETGDWYAQAEIEMPAWQGHSDSTKFKVWPNL